MASLKFFSLIVLISLLSIYAPFSSFEDYGINVLESQKVNLSMYYETLCPYFVNFIVNELVKVFEGDLMSIINLRLVHMEMLIFKNLTVPLFARYISLLHFLICLIACIIEFGWLMTWHFAAWPRWMLLEQYRSLCDQHLVRPSFCWFIVLFLQDKQKMNHSFTFFFQV